jgi:hypothetical protein
MSSLLLQNLLQEVADVLPRPAPSLLNELEAALKCVQIAEQSGRSKQFLPLIQASICQAFAVQVEDVEDLDCLSAQRVELGNLQHGRGAFSSFALSEVSKDIHSNSHPRQQFSAIRRRDTSPELDPTPSFRRRE